MTFLHHVFKNKKKLFLKSETRELNIPHWPELGLKQMWPIAHTVPGLPDYLPSDWTLANNKIERRFFWVIFSTMAPDYVGDLVNDARTQRAEYHLNKKVIPKTLPVSAEWAEKLLMHAAHSSKYLPQTGFYFICALFN